MNSIDIHKDIYKIFLINLFKYKFFYIESNKFWNEKKLF